MGMGPASVKRYNEFDSLIVCFGIPPPAKWRRRSVSCCEAYASAMAEIAERTRYFERYVTFVDAIVAIAITLLVLPLVELTSDHHGTTSELLRDHAAQFYSFALSFLVIFRLWWSQHRLLRFVVDGDKVVVRGLGLWVMTIVFLPFPTALVAAPSQDLGTRALYIGTMAASAACLAVVAWGLVRNPSLSEENAKPHFTAEIVTFLIMVVALLVSVLVPVTSYFPLFLLLLSTPIEKLWNRVAAKWSRGEGEMS